MIFTTKETNALRKMVKMPIVLFSIHRGQLQNFSYNFDRFCPYPIKQTTKCIRCEWRYQRKINTPLVYRKNGNISNWGGRSCRYMQCTQKWNTDILSKMWYTILVAVLTNCPVNITDRKFTLETVCWTKHGKSKKTFLYKVCLKNRFLAI